jgi:hypothetical protein
VKFAISADLAVSQALLVSLAEQEPWVRKEPKGQRVLGAEAVAHKAHKGFKVRQDHRDSEELKAHRAYKERKGHKERKVLRVPRAFKEHRAPSVQQALRVRRACRVSKVRKAYKAHKALRVRKERKATTERPALWVIKAPKATQEYKDHRDPWALRDRGVPRVYLRPLVPKGCEGCQEQQERKVLAVRTGRQRWRKGRSFSHLLS